MTGIRKKYTPEFKAKVAIEAIKEKKTTSQISSEYSILPVQVSQWKKELLTRTREIFEVKSTKQKKEKDINQSELYQVIGQLKVEAEWLKKKLQI